jgi:8-oxo-dGTP pyrophosphatase MutT (NUDIX family)
MIADTKEAHLISQSGVIPYRIRDGRLEIALVTASSGPHWTIPKGHVEPDLTPHASAAKEAYEESGLLGHVQRRVVGTYVYEKRGKARKVEIFPLHVQKELRRWPEMLVRKRRWMSAEEAASRVKSAELRCCIQEFKKNVKRAMKRGEGAQRRIAVAA